MDSPGDLTTEQGIIKDKQLALCLSGGGLRATFFHFGVVKALAEGGHLNSIKHIIAVSGGSILAGHMIRNWDCYAGPNSDLGKVEKELVDLAARGMRERVLRRYFVTAFGYFRRYIQQRTIQKEYARILGIGTIADCYRNNPNRDAMPDVHFMCTNFNSGEVCSFTKDRFIIFRKPPNSIVEKDGLQRKFSAEKIAMAVSSDTIELSFAVAASSAFPGLFPPMRLDAAKLGSTARDFPVTVFLSDGGIYDNLGLEHFIESVSEMVPETQAVIVSNASGAFQWNNTNEYYGLLSRNVRTVDILMDLMIEERWGRTSERLVAKGIDLLRADIGFTKWADGAPPISVQQQIQNMRTDLDKFSRDEINLLIEHGYRVACHQAGLVDPPHSTSPVSEPLKPDRPRQLDALAKAGAERKLRLFDKHDPLASVGAFLSIILVSLPFIYAAFSLYLIPKISSKYEIKIRDFEDKLAISRAEISEKQKIIEQSGNEMALLLEKFNNIRMNASDISSAFNNIAKGAVDISSNPASAIQGAQVAETIKKTQSELESSIQGIDKIIDLNRAFPSNINRADNSHANDMPNKEVINDLPYPRHRYRVWLQFAGLFSREDMIDFGNALVTRWPNAPGATQGGERTENAAGMFEVRYGPREDEDAAIALTRDILDLKIVPKMNKPVRVTTIPKRSLEIWLSR